MDVDILKQQVHRITNLLQEVLGYLEIQEYIKALSAVKRTIRELRGLATQVSGLCDSQPLPEGSVVVVPHGTRTVSSEDVTVDIPPGDVAIVSESDVRKGQGKKNRISK